MMKTRPPRRRFKILLLAAVAALGVFGGLTGCQSMEDALYDDYRSQGICFVTACDPQVGTVGTPVTIVGELFGDTQGTGQVLFYGGADGGGVAAAIEGWTDKAIFCRVPNVDAKDVKIRVQVVRDDGVKCPYYVDFVVLTSDG